MNESGFLVFTTLIAFLWIDGRDCCGNDDTPKPTPKPGCRYKGRDYESGSMWVDGEDSRLSCSCVEGVFTCKTAVCWIESGIRYSGHDYPWQKVSKGEAGVKKCQQKCIDNPNCVGFTLHKKYGKCFTKTKMARRKKQNGYTSGRCIAETKACRIEQGVRYSGHDHPVTYVKKGEAGVDQCQLTCVEMRRNATKCDGFTLDKERGKCFTKTRMARRKQQTGYTSGVCVPDGPSYCSKFRKPPIWKICQREDAKERPCCKKVVELYDLCREIDLKEYPQCYFSPPNAGYFKERQCNDPSGRCVCVCKSGVSKSFSTNCTESTESAFELEYERLSTELAALEFADEEFAALNLYKKN